MGLTVLKLNGEPLPDSEPISEEVKPAEDAPKLRPFQVKAGLDELDITRVRVRSAPLTARSPVSSPEADLLCAAEQYRIVRTRVVQRLGETFRLVITSPSTADGKTVTAVNLAGVLALKSEGHTLLIDADLRRASVHRWFDAPQLPGLAEVLAGQCRLEDAIFAIEGLPRLCVLPAGEPKENPTELLDSSRWRSLAALVRRDFSHVIVDSPPVEVVADYDLISAVCDGVVLVVRPDHTNRRSCMEAIAKLRPKLTGILINEARDWFLWKRPAHDGYYYRRDSSRPDKQA